MSGQAKRPKPGERKIQILQTWALMLQESGDARITTAALAARLSVSEAALYRHFASKAQMVEGLIEFIEQSIFGLINQIEQKHADPIWRVQSIALMLIEFAQANPGMTRVLIGDSSVLEIERLQRRIQQMLERIELSLKQAFRQIDCHKIDPAYAAEAIMAWVTGHWLGFVRSGFKPLDAERLRAQCLLFLG